MIPTSKSSTVYVYAAFLTVKSAPVLPVLSVMLDFPLVLIDFLAIVSASIIAQPALT